MPFIDDQTKAQPLLEQYGIILTPFDIDADACKELMWALHVGRQLHPDKPLELRCNGNGGESDESFALAELIQVDGNVYGVALGGISSGHTVVWAATAKRFIGPYTDVKIHRAGLGEWLSGDDLPVHEYRAFSLRITDARLARLYAGVSNKSVAWWAERLAETRKNVFQIFTPDQIVNDLEMARPLGEMER